MVAEVEVLLHVDDVVQVVLVFALDDVQDLQLHQSLVMEPEWKIVHLFTDTATLFPHLREKINRGILFSSLDPTRETSPHLMNVIHPRGL